MIKIIRLTAICAVFFSFAFISNDADAACTNPPADEGVQVYNPTHQVMQFCNGTTWISMGSISPGAGGGGGLSFAGYTTTTYNGNLGGTKGADEKCNTEYAGSRAMRYDDLAKLGTNYPWTTTSWVLDGVAFTESRNYTKDGAANDAGASVLNRNCRGWAWNGSSDIAARTNGTKLAFSNCNTTYSLSCVTD